MGALSCEKVVNRLALCLGAGKECEEGVAERMCDEWNHSPHSPYPDEVEEVDNSGVKLSPGRGGLFKVLFLFLIILL